MEHQIAGIQFIFNSLFGLTDPEFPDLSGCILADTMGLGKTLQIITLIDILTKQNPYSNDRPYIKKCIVVAPVTLLGNWQREFQKWLKDDMKPIVARTGDKTSKEII